MDGVYEVGDVETPKEGGETTALRETFVDLDVGVVVGEPVENVVHEGVVKVWMRCQRSRGMLKLCRWRRSWSRRPVGKPVQCHRRGRR